MGKYEILEKDVFSVFDSQPWKDLELETYPSNYIVDSPADEFLRISIIPSGRGLNLSSVSGILVIDIFIPAGKGPKRSAIIADILDTYLVGKSLSTVSGNTTQFGNSFMSPQGTDVDNSSLFRAVYTIPFNFFGA